MNHESLRGLPLGQIPVLSIEDERRYRAAIEEGDGSMASVIQQEAAAEFAKGKGIQAEMLGVANALTEGRAKMCLPRENSKHAGRIVEINERYALQQLGESNIFVAHPFDGLNGQQLTAGKRYLMEYKDGASTVQVTA